MSDHAKEFAIRVVKRLREAGFEALWAGGCVRDHLRGVTPNDFDVATNATPGEVRDLFGKHRTLAIGEQFGVIVVLGPKQGDGAELLQQQVEVATFRKDVNYHDGRRPTSVEFSSAEEDAKRRDFTVNGLFYDPIKENVIDYVDGQSDLKRRVIRAIGNPNDRFDEDKLRMLRAVRFASTLDYQIEPMTFDAIVKRASEITIVSAERIATELRKVFASPHRRRGFMLLCKTKLLASILSEEAQALFDHQPKIERRVAALKEGGLPECMALMYDVIRSSENGLEKRSGASPHLVSACRRLRLSNRERELADWIISHIRMMSRASTEYWPAVQRVLVHPDIEPLLHCVTAIQSAEPSSANESVDFCRSKLALPPDELNPAPLIDGNDLRNRGIPRGAIYRTILDRVRDEQLLGNIGSRDAAMRLVDEIVKMEA